MHFGLEVTDITVRADMARCQNCSLSLTIFFMLLLLLHYLFQYSFLLNKGILMVFIKAIFINTKCFCLFF